MSWAGLSALEKRRNRIELLASQITGLTARIEEKAAEVERLAKEMEEISILDANDKPFEAVTNSSI